MEEIKVKCDTCGRKKKIHTSNREDTEAKIIAGDYKCDRKECPHGKLRMLENQ